jgi:hypothetical protein
MIHGQEANCRFCGHYRNDRRCAAFPDGIPDALWSGDNPHREPFPGDGGILYVRKPMNIDLDEDIPVIPKES